ncbi:MAG: 2-dehydropantoate 2-reductase [Acidimicrobiia bacterium]|nr:2-dehydropantoate 2-reductase [Acidimicrobiia bacterium]
MTSHGRQTVAVVGVGSVGGFFGARAAMLPGNDVSFCVRTPFDELVLESEGEEIRVDAPTHTDPSEVDIHDWVLLAVKAHQTEAAAPWLEALCSPTTVIAVLQNGVEHVERVTPYANGAKVLPTILRYGGEAVEPGRVRHYTYGYLYALDDDIGARLAALFGNDDDIVQLTPEFEKQAWSKLVTNVAANAIPAITEQRFPVFRLPEVARLSEGLMIECLNVAATEGVALDRDIARSEVTRLAGLPDNVGSSMLYDRLAGRSLEYDALNGAVVRIGTRHGLHTPLNETMVALLSAISAGGAS